MSKLTLQLSPEMEAVLDEMAAELDLSKSHILRRAVMLMKYLDDQVEANSDILLRDRGTGDVRQVVLEHQVMRSGLSAHRTPAE